jgi:hypothetical protein
MQPDKAMNLLQAGEHTHGMANPIPADGWNYTIIGPNDDDAIGGLDGHLYYLEEAAAGSPFVATLNWFAPTTSNYNAGTTDNLGTVTYTRSDPYDLDLDLYEWDGATATLVARSFSNVDNLEHIYLPHLPASSDYLLRVENTPHTDGETYAISWSFAQVPEPGGAMMLLVVTVTILRRSKSRHGI